MLSGLTTEIEGARSRMWRDVVEKGEQNKALLVRLSIIWCLW